MGHLPARPNCPEILLPICSRVNVLTVCHVQTHIRNNGTGLHPHPSVDAHCPTVVKRHLDLTHTSIPNAIATVARMLTEAQNWAILAASSTNAIAGKRAGRPAPAPAIAMIVARVD